MPDRPDRPRPLRPDPGDRAVGTAAATRAPGPSLTRRLHDPSLVITRNTKETDHDTIPLRHAAFVLRAPEGAEAHRPIAWPSTSVAPTRPVTPRPTSEPIRRDHDVAVGPTELLVPVTAEAIDARTCRSPSSSTSTRGWPSRTCSSNASPVRARSFARRLPPATWTRPLFAPAVPVPHTPLQTENLGPWPRGKALGITLGDWFAAKGEGSYACADGTGHVDIRFENLVPDGLYTMWHDFAIWPPTEPFIGFYDTPVRRPRRVRERVHRRRGGVPAFVRDDHALSAALGRAADLGTGHRLAQRREDLRLHAG